MNGNAPITRVICWTCGDRVPVKYGGSACPSCGAMLVSSAYDAAAQRLVSQRVTLERDLNALICAHDEAERANTRWGRLRVLPFLPSRRKLRRLEGKQAAVRAQVDEVTHRLRDLASARYYMGGWYRATGIGLRCDASTASGFDRNPFAGASYDSVGVFQLRTKLGTKALRGIFGEYCVFSLLDGALGEGDIGAGCLLRSLYIPDYSSPERDRYGASFTEEIDLLLMTSRALYVIEVKNLRGDITVRPQRFCDRYDIEVAPRGKSARSPAPNLRTDRGPSQNHRHLCALAHALEGIVDRRAFVNLVVYVDNGFEFIMETPQGLGGAYIATTGQGNANVIETIKSIECAREQIWSMAEVEAISAMIDARYSDVDGSKAETHQRMCEMRARAPRVGRGGGTYRSHSKRSKKFGGAQAYPGAHGGRDAELERMLRKLR